ncbi:PLP-dependent aminotransferase family protein [Propioniciclava tarda]|uniref:PLP-dependent aminotransferase family protein n=1 Tax=Propioniciclava tarda TaxID=433330 RepID=A0A4Q9KQE2_PROTD|nr:PLP-dependent aminotransferase family protein [Propioniciclava tarda]TBT96280.1 PLP-dependent aminotransferase family protein [Propioniciclava tarda]SMO34767.1 2-aminoadipate transaminase [Propioniciclava tarda]
MTFEFPLIDLYAGEIADPVGDLFASLNTPGLISFAGGMPDASLFDADSLRASFDHVLATDGRRALQYGTSEGDAGLRAIAASRVSRHVPTSADQIQITSGSQEAIYLTALVMLNPGDVILVEEPTYLAAVQAFDLVGATMVGVHTDDEGVDPDALAAAIATHRPRAVYLNPTYSNPTGRTLSAARRAAVAEVLLASDVALVEDDPYGELGFDAPAPAPIASLPGMASRTLLLNSLSKVMAPGVRLGWIRGEGPIMRALAVAKGAVTMQSPALNQLAVAHYLAGNDLDAHIARVRELYRPRRDAMYAGLRAMLPAASITHPDGGMFCWVDLNDGRDTRPLLDAAVRAGVAFAPGWSFYAGGPRLSTMRLSFVTNPVDVIADGLGRLQIALTDGDPDTRSRHPHGAASPSRSIRLLTDQGRSRADGVPETMLDDRHAEPPRRVAQRGWDSVSTLPARHPWPQTASREAGPTIDPAPRV